jgi:hypothetical protein
VFALVHDIAGQTSQPERQLSAEIEKRPDQDEQPAEHQQSPAKFAKGVHGLSP